MESSDYRRAMTPYLSEYEDSLRLAYLDLPTIWDPEERKLEGARRGQLVASAGRHLRRNLLGVILKVISRENRRDMTLLAAMEVSKSLVDWAPNRKWLLDSGVCQTGRNQKLNQLPNIDQLIQHPDREAWKEAYDAKCDEALHILQSYSATRYKGNQR